MGLFDKVLGSSTDTLNDAEGFAGVAFAAVAADGVLEQEEQMALVTTLSRMKLYSGMNNRQIGGVFEKLVKIARSEGIDALVAKSAAAVKPELRQTAFATAADLVMSDGHVAGEEKRLLEKIQKALGIDDGTAVKIVEVIAIKNQG